MHKGKIEGAFSAWSMAITEKLTRNDPYSSLLELATAYGKYITDEESLDIVAEIFNWNKVNELIKSGTVQAN
jgi:hypothetical protein